MRVGNKSRGVTMKTFGFDVTIRNGCIVLLIGCVALLMFSLSALGQSGGQYDLTWSTIDGGGGTSSGGDFTLRGTIGQPDAGAITGGDYEMLGGFLPGVPICIVNFEHFAIFAANWLETGCNDQNDWCGGADLSHMDDVGLEDLRLFVDEWLNCCPVDWPLK